MGWVTVTRETLNEADFLANRRVTWTSVIAAVPAEGLVMASRSPNNDNSNTLPYIAQEITKDPEQTIANSGACDGKITVHCGRTTCLLLLLLINILRFLPQ